MSDLPLLNPTQDAALARRLIDEVQKYLKTLDHTLTTVTLDQRSYDQKIGARTEIEKLRQRMEQIYDSEVNK